MAQTRPERTLGPGHDTFWDYCAQGELRLPRCEACGKLAWPVVAACDRCGGRDFTWEPMSGRGTIVSWCTFERDYYAGTLPMPWDVILVELEEGPLFISNPNGFGREDVTIDMAVRLAFLPCEDAAGRFNLPTFAAA